MSLQTARSFVPRPKKKQGNEFRLGTVSDHGFGVAIDVESDANPDLSPRQFAAIQHYAGTHVDRSHVRWKYDSLGLWTDIHNLSQAFIATLEAAADTKWRQSMTAAVAVGRQASARATFKESFKLDELKRLAGERLFSAVTSRRTRPGSHDRWSM